MGDVSDMLANGLRPLCPLNGLRSCVGVSCAVIIGHEMRSPGTGEAITYYTCGFAEAGDKSDGGLINIVAAEYGESDDE